LKIARVLYNDTVEYTIIEGESVRFIEGSIYTEEIRAGKRSVPINEVKILSPVMPSKVICVGLNYKDHAEELNMPIPDEPILFLKPPTGIIGPGDVIVYPDGIGRLDYEAELAIIMKKEARKIKREDATDYILGYTCLNDVTARDLQKKDGQWTRAKSFDTFCPLGPCICTDLAPQDTPIRLRLNSEIRQSSNTANLIFPVEVLLSFISDIMTLLPGDVIATGTPPGVGPCQKGDRVEIDIPNVGLLSNTII